MNKEVRAYLAEIGRRGGKKSRRQLTPSQARQMVRVREARRAFERYRATCFWSHDPDYVVTAADVDWIAEQLRRTGGRSAWQTAARLCP